MMRKFTSLITCCLFFCAMHQVAAQQDSSAKRINIIQADRYNFQKIDTAGDFISLAGNVKLRQDKTWFDCDSVVLNQKANEMEAFGKIHINDADSVHTYAQYLKYIGKDKKAYLKKNVKLTDGKGTLTTDELEYETEAKIGIYKKGGKVVNGKTVLTSTEGYYYGDTRDVYFKKKVVLNDPDFKVKTDTLLYNINTEIATFVSPTDIVTGSRKIKTKDGFYNLKTKEAYFGKRSEIQDSTLFITGDKIAFEDSSGYGHAQGNVIFRDETQGFTILANDVKSNQKKASFLASQKPVMIIKQDQDSIFITADTLYSARISDAKKSRTVPMIMDTVKGKKVVTEVDTTIRFFEAYSHVKIFTDSLQAIGDSLFYSAEDSAFRLFKNPVVWAQQNQITGDTIYLYTKNKKPEKLYVFENASAISKLEPDYYNQVRGNTITAWFLDGNINTLRAKGSAESVYYAVDDEGSFIGVNKASSDVIDMYFENKKPQKVVFRNNLKGVTTPMRQANHEEMKLRGFNWQENKRPKTRLDIFGE